MEFEREKDMRGNDLFLTLLICAVAYKEADGKKIDNRRVVVDYERGRISKSWRPRRLGGGRGFTRAGKEDLNAKFSDQPKDDKQDKERERSREKSPEKEKPREREREREHKTSSSSSSRHDGKDREKDRSGKRERERDRAGSERYL